MVTYRLSLQMAILGSIFPRLKAKHWNWYMLVFCQSGSVELNWYKEYALSLHLCRG